MIEGQKIVASRPMSEEEMRSLGWYGEPAVCLVLENGTILFPSRDPEGNGPGALFGADGAELFTLLATEVPR